MSISQKGLGADVVIMPSDAISGTLKSKDQWRGPYEGSKMGYQNTTLEVGISQVQCQ